MKYKDFFYNPNYEFRRPRSIDTSFNQKPSNEDEIKANQAYINTVYSSYENAADKSNVLLKYTKEVAQKYRIPVPKESIEIRSALSRLNLPLDYIEFETFQNCIEKIEKEASKINFSIFDTVLTSDPLANERIVKNKLNEGSDNLGGLLSLATQFGALYAIHQISAMWRSEETANTAPPLSAPEAIKEAVAGIAASFAIMGINQTLEYLGNESINNVKTDNINNIIEQAKQAKLPPMLEILKKQMGENDHKIIIKYCLSYISSSKDKGYEFWMAYYGARKVRFLSKVSRNLAPLFSDKYSGVEETINPEDILATPGPLTNIAAQIVNLLNNSVTYPTDIYVCIQDYEASNFESGLNRVAQVLDTKLSRDAICCFVRFFGKIDIDTLKRIRAILGIYINANLIDLNTTLENFESYLLSWVNETIQRLLLSLVNLIISEIIKELGAFINKLAPEVTVISECPLILELLQKIVDAIFLIIRDIREIANNYLKTLVYNSMSIGIGLLEFDSNFSVNNSNLYRIHKKRYIGQIVNLLDKIIETVELGNLFCDDKTNNPKEITYDEFLDKYQSLNDQDFLNIPEDIKKSYFNDATELKFSDGSRLPSYNIGVIDIGNGSNGNSDNDCISFLNSLLPKDLIERFNKK